MTFALIVIEFQTRRHSGELRYFDSLAKAFDDADDPEVWKISFSVGKERVRLVRRNYGQQSGEIWVFESVMDELAWYIGEEKAAKLIDTLKPER